MSFYKRYRSPIFFEVKMKRIRLIIAIIISVFGVMQMQAAQLPNESLNYVITYKWGLIHKDAAEATLSLRNVGNKYEVALTARTQNWADKFFMVRDTLLATMNSRNMKPLRYTKISHEGGRYDKDEIRYETTNDKTIGYARSFTRKKNGETRNSEKTLTASGPVYDMLTVFYYLRQIDYNKMSKGQELRATVFSGSKAERLTVKCDGMERITLRNKKEADAYHIRFNFTTDGKKKSSDDIDCWISADARHIPLYMVGKLPIGQVRVYYAGN